MFSTFSTGKALDARLETGTLSQASSNATHSQNFKGYFIVFTKLRCLSSLEWNLLHSEILRLDDFRRKQN